MKRRIFQGDSFLAMLLVLSKVPLPLIVTKVKASYEWGKKKYKPNHLLFMDNSELFSKSEERMDTFVRTVHVLSTNIGMKFGMKKYETLTMKRR